MDKHDYDKKLEKELEKFATNTYTLIEQAIIIAENSTKDNIPKIEVFATLDGITAEWKTERYSVVVDYVIGQGSSLCIENKFGTSNKECKDIKEAVSLALEYIENDKKIVLNTASGIRVVGTEISDKVSPNLTAITANAKACPICGSYDTDHSTNNNSLGMCYCNRCGYRWKE